MHSQFHIRQFMRSGILIGVVMGLLCMLVAPAETRAAVKTSLSPATLAVSLSNCCDNRACDDPLYTCKKESNSSCEQGSYGSGYAVCHTDTCH